MMALTSPPSGTSSGGEAIQWNLQTSVNLIQSVKVARGTSGGVELTMILVLENPPLVERRISRPAINGQADLANRVPLNTLGTCETIFLVQCQVLRTALSTLMTSDCH
jgi:hypothetical protein